MGADRRSPAQLQQSSNVGLQYDISRRAPDNDRRGDRSSEGIVKNDWYVSVTRLVISSLGIDVVEVIAECLIFYNFMFFHLACAFSLDKFS